MALKPECWPDPQGMVDELQGLGIEVMTTHWPFMSTESVHRAESVKKNKKKNKKKTKKKNKEKAKKKTLKAMAIWQLV
jgi:alpha-glucosidase (family GH31 glycosyl hydrolase)